ncbi:(Fe-S)-binding protein [Pyrobaculum aerophilum]|uniref:(Fe-S)-binding protein n=1 Tax=Pyrobaculum aerophilum TaxID=13773 RepID=UPI0023EFCD8B|nr:(Fe-S)-binding protein [Pyrobaculum aerophilum]MCX8136321.1 (Fe-S)-binding protein [Pyrobaculum aerophilum]
MEPSLNWLFKLRDLIVSSLQERKLPLPVDRELCNKWQEGLPSRGVKRVFYTSCMYQLAPAIYKAVESLEKFGVAKGGVTARLAAVGAKLLGGVVLRPEREDLERSYTIVRSIYTALFNSGVEIGYLPDEPYSGALLYELGFIDDFAKYASEVYAYFKEKGVREVVTIDPHTHYILEKIYPQYVPDFDLKVTSYLDLIDPSRVRVKISGFTIHDSCLYARYLGKYGKIRELLSKGSPAEDPYITGVETAGCCGGPVESILPELAKKIALGRAKKLASLSRVVVATCPICMVNLSRTGVVEVKHLAEAVEL